LYSVYRLLMGFHLFFSRLYSFPCATGTLSARFNASGSRLLCLERGPVTQLIVYDLPTRHQATTTGRVLLSDPDFSTGGIGTNACCFAGLEDELVLSASEDNSLYVWSLPDGLDCTINRSLRRLPGHDSAIRSIRCSKDQSAIVSCDENGVIKLWTSR
jgi:WD40 repeat protein